MPMRRAIRRRHVGPAFRRADSRPARASRCGMRRRPTRTRSGADDAIASQSTPASSSEAHLQPNLVHVADNSSAHINDPRVVSDATPDNTWIPGAQYAAGWPHHWVPWGTFGKYKLAPATRRVFVDATSGPLGDTTVNRWSAEHKAYNEAVDEAFKSFLKRNNIPLDQTERLTPAQADEFLDEIYLSDEPRIRNFNKKIRYQAFRYWMRHGPGRRGGDENNGQRARFRRRAAVQNL